MYLCKQSWRWYGPNDPVSLADIRQAGATDIVTALHHIPNGEVWTVEEIQKRQQTVADAGLTWSVVESVPVHEHIKTRTGDFQRYIDNYKQSIRNLAACGIKVITTISCPCWTGRARTSPTNCPTDRAPCGSSVRRSWPSTSTSSNAPAPSRKEYTEAERALSPSPLRKDGRCGDRTHHPQHDRGPARLGGELHAGAVPAGAGPLKGSSTAETLRGNLIAFLKGGGPVADEVGAVLAIHPDDPPYPILGLPRILSTESDFEKLVAAVPNASNGLCLCTDRSACRRRTTCRG